MNTAVAQKFITVLVPAKNKILTFIITDYPARHKRSIGWWRPSRRGIASSTRTSSQTLTPAMSSLSPSSCLTRHCTTRASRTSRPSISSSRWIGASTTAVIYRASSSFPCTSRSRRNRLRFLKTTATIWCTRSSIRTGRVGSGSKVAGTRPGRDAGSSWMTTASITSSSPQTRNLEGSFHLKIFELGRSRTAASRTASSSTQWTTKSSRPARLTPKAKSWKVSCEVLKAFIFIFSVTCPHADKRFHETLK